MPQGWLRREELLYQDQEELDLIKDSQLLVEVARAANLEFNICRTQMLKKYYQIKQLVKESKGRLAMKLLFPNINWNNGE